MRLLSCARRLRAFPSGNTALLIDLSNVTYINSTAIGVLVAAHATYTRKGWRIKVCGMNKNINNIFVITKLTLVFDVHDTREQAA